VYGRGGAASLRMSCLPTDAVLWYLGVCHLLCVCVHGDESVCGREGGRVAAYVTPTISCCSLLPWCMRSVVYVCVWG